MPADRIARSPNHEEKQLSGRRVQRESRVARIGQGRYQIRWYTFSIDFFVHEHCVFLCCISRILHSFLTLCIYLENAWRLAVRSVIARKGV